MLLHRHRAQLTEGGNKARLKQEEEEEKKKEREHEDAEDTGIRRAVTL